MLGVNRSWQLPNLPVWFRWLPVLPVLVALVLILIFQQNINDWLNQNWDEPDETITELPAEPELPMVVVEDNTVTSNAQAEKQNLIELLDALEAEQALEIEAAPEETTATDTTQSTLSASEQVSEKDQSEPETAAPNNDQPASVIPPFTPLNKMPEQKATIAPTTDAASPKSTDANPSANNPENGANDVRDAAWILQQKQSAYTYQLMGTWERAAVDDFIEKYSLTGDVSVFASMRENKIWYALIYGVYDSRKAALDANRQWHAPLNSISTWLRRFDGVQTQIKEKATDG